MMMMMMMKPSLLQKLSSLDPISTLCPKHSFPKKVVECTPSPTKMSLFKMILGSGMQEIVAFMAKKLTMQKFDIFFQNNNRANLVFI